MKITDTIKYVGVNDHRIDLFEGQYKVPNGMSYNSYVILDEKIAVMDTVDADFTHQWLDNIQQVLNGRKPDYLIVQHMEPDHAANIANFLKVYPDTTVVATAKAFNMIRNFFELDLDGQKVIAENGSTLSGGERQRISIARALLKDAPIILLDEATASLDPENEVLIQRAIAKLVEGKTVIMIAHRLRTVVDADQILVLDNGRLVEHGTHDELMKKNGLYHKLFHIQQESLGWAV